MSSCVDNFKFVNEHCTVDHQHLLCHLKAPVYQLRYLEVTEELTKFSKQFKIKKVI